ncbi:hypothetical protein D3C87_2046300 [compost metagenome]
MPFQQIAALGFVVGARHRRQVDLEQRGQTALRRQAVARAQAAIGQRALEHVGDLQVARTAVLHERRDPGMDSAFFLYGF